MYLGSIGRFFHIAFLAVSAIFIVDLYMTFAPNVYWIALFLIPVFLINIIPMNILHTITIDKEKIIISNIFSKHTFKINEFDSIKRSSMITPIYFKFCLKNKKHFTYLDFSYSTNQLPFWDYSFKKQDMYAKEQTDKILNYINNI